MECSDPDHRTKPEPTETRRLYPGMETMRCELRDVKEAWGAFLVE